MAWDPGLQFERTDLSWRRTVLAATLGLVLAGRYLGADHPVLSFLLPVLALLLGLTLLRVATARIHRAERVVRAVTIGVPSTTTAMPGGGLLALTALMAGLAALVGAIYVVSGVIAN